MSAQLAGEMAIGAAARRVLLLVGSAKPRHSSTSEMLGRELLERLVARGHEGDVAWAHVNGSAREALVESLDACDLVLLATPLYFDGLPSHVLALLEAVRDHRRRFPLAPSLAMAAILNCGTPDAHQADSALAMCALAARDARLGWRGGLAFGEGDAIGGRELASIGERGYAAAMDVAADALARDAAILPEAAALAARPLMPEGRYTLLGNAGWLVTARRNNALLRLRDRPYDRE